MIRFRRTTAIGNRQGRRGLPRRPGQQIDQQGAGVIGADLAAQLRGQRRISQVEGQHVVE